MSTEHISEEELHTSAKNVYKNLQARVQELAPSSPTTAGGHRSFNILPIKERMNIEGQPMPTRDPHERAHVMDEVSTGYTAEQAMIEASRCLQCKNKPCVKGCPVSIDIPKFIEAIADGEFKKAVTTIKENNLLPAICGRVCPQEIQCQAQCTVGLAHKDVDKAVAIGRLERFVADWERENQQMTAPICAAPSGKKVAVIGSGPAGIAVAADLCKFGHRVTIFEAFHKAGGVMVYGIPEFRLPKKIVETELAMLAEMGVEFRLNFLVGRTATIQQLLDEQGFDAAFIGSGAGLPKFMDIPGENLIGVFSANEYLTRANLMKAYDREKSDTPLYEAEHVAVIGGGNVAMDAARMAFRLGAKKVSVVYRRTRNEMPARREEVTHAIEEGVQFHFLNNPTKILGNEQGKVRGLELLSYELGEPDKSGRRSPVAIKGSEHELACDAVIVALGNESNPLMARTTEGLSINERGNIIVDNSGATSYTKVWAGGDIVLGAATVILAMGQGRKAATAIHAYLQGE